jgi:hypothetical protein
MQWCNKRKEMIRVQHPDKCGCKDITERYQAELTNYTQWKTSFEERVKLWKLKSEATNIKKERRVIDRQSIICDKKIAHLAEMKENVEKMNIERKRMYTVYITEMEKTDKITDEELREKERVKIETERIRIEKIFETTWTVYLAKKCKCKKVIERRDFVEREMHRIEEAASKIEINRSSGSNQKLHRGRRLNSEEVCEEEKKFVAQQQQERQQDKDLGSPHLNHLRELERERNRQAWMKRIAIKRQQEHDHYKRTGQSQCAHQRYLIELER